MDLGEAQILGDRVGSHWYYRSKAASMLASLAPIEGTTAIDIGSGSGYFARQILTRTSIHQVDCIDSAYRVATTEPVDGDHGILRRNRNLDDADHDVDLVLLMDVLEHVADDIGLLQAAAGRVRPGGRVLVTVPAFQWLWSPHDELLGHLRRYRLDEVEGLVARAGLDIVRGHYLYGPILPLAAVRRLVRRSRPGAEPRSDLTTHSWVVNRLLGAAAALERPVKRHNRLAGLTVLVVGRCP